MKKTIVLLLAAVLAAPVLPVTAQDDKAEKKKPTRAEAREERRAEREERRAERRQKKEEARKKKEEAREAKRNRNKSAEDK
jgi:hypothetical protein